MVRWRPRCWWRWPEIDGATNPTVFGGRLGVETGVGAPKGGLNPMVPDAERVARLAGRVSKLVALRRKAAEDRKLAIVIYGFPPKAGAVGTAAYLSVFESLFNTLHALKAEGYAVEPPPSVEALKRAVLGDEATRRGQEAAVAARIPADELVAREPHLAEIEAAWGPAPGRHQTDGSGVFVLGAFFGESLSAFNQPSAMRAIRCGCCSNGASRPRTPSAPSIASFETISARTPSSHFGMHGALEFMPGKHVGMSAACWPDRLIGDAPHIYLYAANNPSEATLAKRRAGAVMVSHSYAAARKAGLYKGLAELKDTLGRWRATAPEAPEREELAELAAEQAAAVDLEERDPDALWLTLLETEDALVPDGLHVVGGSLPEKTRGEHLEACAPPARGESAVAAAEAALAQQTELPALTRALAGRFTAPAPGGDLVRSPEVLPTGRNIHAFNPFRMPTAYALKEGARQAEALLAKHARLPRSGRSGPLGLRQHQN